MSGAKEPTYEPSDDEARMIAYIRWRATCTPNIDSQITLEVLADDLAAGKHEGER